MAPARRASANVDAPVWKSYVAARVDLGTGSGSAATLSTAHTRTRKRIKPTCSEAVAVSGGGFGSKQHLATRAAVRAYWESLTVAERLQILMVDNPDIVKQLYKLNLSLLCVGLMQRHLKAGTARTVAASTSTATATPASGASTRATDDVPVTASAASTTTEPGKAAADVSVASDSERTYDLLEAMEFMDIGTGILTVKTELVEDVDHMFALVTAVLHGFLFTIHVLSESQFRDLFVVESEVINTWEDYERLIAMLVEQLMLRSYVAYLERQATQQMEALLLEASLEEKNTHSGQRLAVAQSTAASQKKKKKKKKKAKSTKIATALVESNEVVQGNAMSDSESEPDKEEVVDIAAEEFTCQSECSTEDADLSGPSSPVKSISKALNRLNPHARAFEPSALMITPIDELRSPTSGKRKLDDFIIHIPWQDMVDGFDQEDTDGEESLTVISGELGCRRPREKYRRREEDAELEWHLQHMYASTSSIFGWDFNEQREITAAAPIGLWADTSLWRTEPRDVVRYYFPPSDRPGAFSNPAFPPSSGFAPFPHAGPPSRYYYTPPDHTARNAGVPSSPRSAVAASSMFSPPFMSPATGPPVSFWDENSAHSLAYPAVFEPKPHPRFRSTSSSPARRRKSTPASER